MQNSSFPRKARFMIEKKVLRPNIIAQEVS